MEDLGGGFDDQPRPLETVPPEGIEQAGHFPPPLDLVVAIVSLGEALEAEDEGLAIGQSIGADAMGNAGSEDLLGSAAADAEEKLECRAVDGRVWKILKLPDDGGEITIPLGFCGHEYFPMLLRTCEIWQMPRKFPPSTGPPGARDTFRRMAR